MNHRETNMLKSKNVLGGVEKIQKKNKKTKVHNNHNIKSKGWSCGETLVEKPRKEEK